MESNYKPIHTKYGGGEDELLEPVSPLSQSLDNSIVSLFVVGVFELENPVNESRILEFLRDEFVPICPRFSSVIETDKQGVKRWKKVEIRVEDHLVIPTFPSGLQRKDYDEHIKEYISKIGLEKFSEGRPLWEAHLIKYPSLNGVGSVVFKFSHAIGDGYSFMKVLCSGMKRADNPDLPFTFPNIALRKNERTKVGSFGFLSKLFNTVYDIIWSASKVGFAFLQDRPNAVRSGSAETGMNPFTIHSLTIPLEKVKQVKSKLEATMNDVITGIISYVIHLYMMRTGQISDTSMTILVMLNMRILKGYKDVHEMIKATDTWGNQSRFLHVPMPSFRNPENVNPLDFITKAKENMDKKKNSMYIYLIDPLINMWGKLQGQKGLADMVYASFKYSSTMITSVIGAKEQMALVGNPVSSYYFLVTGVPQSLTFTSISSMDELKLVATMEKGVIDSQVFISCMNEAFDNIFQAAFPPASDDKKSI